MYGLARHIFAIAPLARRRTMLDSQNRMFFAHSLEGRDRAAWQPLGIHLENVSRLTSLRAEKFGARRLGAVVGLLHDLGKYSREFQDYIAHQGQSPDHATAGSREILRLAPATGQDRLVALIGAYCIAGHHSGLANWNTDPALSRRLEKTLPPLDPAWQHELAPEASGLFPDHFKPHDDKCRRAFQLAMFGRMLFSCLVDADYRDTEAFYSEAEGKPVDREWPTLAAIADGLIARFDAHMTAIQAAAGGNPLLCSLRADILTRDAKVCRHALECRLSGRLTGARSSRRCCIKEPTRLRSGNSPS
jgi:CRISPR-associated endonuclease/helicase Cas3